MGSQEDRIRKIREMVELLTRDLDAKEPEGMESEESEAPIPSSDSLPDENSEVFTQDRLSKKRCLRCGYTWTCHLERTKDGVRPVKCPQCKSPYWDKKPIDWAALERKKKAMKKAWARRKYGQGTSH